MSMGVYAVSTLKAEVLFYYYTSFFHNPVVVRSDVHINC